MVAAQMNFIFVSGFCTGSELGWYTWYCN